MFSVHAHRRGEGPAMKRKKIEKLRFYKSYDTLTTIQLGEKTQITYCPAEKMGRSKLEVKKLDFWPN